jgi:hypothetical protein
MGILQIPFAKRHGKVPKYGCAEPKTAPELLVFHGVDCAGRFCRQIHSQNLARTPA